MSFERPLRGSCACHRNQYFIRPPQGASEVAQVLFGTDASHRIAQASPISAHIRIPLEWYHSATYALFPDETAAQIRRVYEHPSERHARRQFCGFCGTPLTYWSEQPRTEADYIQVTMGSLYREDLGDLEDMGLIPDSPVDNRQFELAARGGHEPSTAAGGAAGSPAATGSATAVQQTRGRETTSIPWFDSIMEGSSLGGRLRTTKGTRQSADGSTRIEFEIMEYNDDADGGNSPPATGKRKLGDRDDVEERRT
ncbi:hypothetical protein BD289DRAFT_487157 [Coniella lustricola]|uniref:Mss4-like protein n=1 Tax=Coniella lustricola TaxID=2025994 RepID=A0A2T2ZSP8_9PEZI|nr:hypothetical protein BD289DRAFT_487157 [Coniella lustricola]